MLYKDKPPLPRKADSRRGLAAAGRLLLLVGSLNLLVSVVLYVVEHGNEPVLFLGGGGTSNAAKTPTPNSIHVVLTSNGNPCATIQLRVNASTAQL
jgi:hypothetical protein